MTPRGKGLFVTGTGTDVGKTVVTAGVLRHLRRGGRDASVMKPFQTGCSRNAAGDWVAPDLEFCLAVGRLNPAPDERALMCPYAYGPACSPHLAARMAGERPELEVVTAAAAQLLARHELVVAEGAGGILVPINERELMLDLMVQLGWPVLLVARGGLGTLNETLLSIRCLRQAGLICAGIVVCDTAAAKNDFVREDNPISMTQFSGVDVIGRIPFLGDNLSTDAAWERFDAGMTRWPLENTP